MNLKNCKYEDSITLNKDGDLDDFENGECGYRVFYSVPLDILKKYFKNLDPDVVAGEIEFTVENGKQTGEVLLWSVVESEDGFLNDDFILLFEDISILVEDFKKRIEYIE